MTARSLAAALACTLALAGCSVPPLSQAPDAARPALPSQWSVAGQGAPAQIQAAWWQAFGDPLLTRWVELAQARNGDVLLALSRVDEARANLDVAGAAGLPQVSATAGASTGRSLGARGLTHTRSVQPGLQASWEPDLWGRIAHQEQSAALRLQASEADRDAVALSVAATTAQAYVGLRALQQQLAVAQATARSRQDALRLADDQVSVGYISQLQRTQAQAELQSVQQAVEQLELSLARQRTALLLLAGGEGDADAAALMADSQASVQALQLPQAPAAGLPSALLQRRPDIARAQLQLAAADEAMALQRAAFLPQVSLTASAGSLLVNALQYHPATVWALGGSVLAPLFTGGRLQGQFDAATAQRDQAAHAYRNVVLKAMADVENALVGTQRLQSQWQHASEREAVLQRSLGFARDRYEAGYASYLEELDAQRNLFQAQQEVIRLRLGQLENAIALYQALGGGWQAAASAP
ncbi:Probable efflux pump outer membrane protein ttgC precursor [Delftia tsuruhatensis]|uniref:efflux transporter outer membrane subunit n=1 Tax=Delftia tsuruhatensis TaxID=180282 RepID=UPI001E764394|nr:efflux transporter outer membrane subunit [Delftia tsuruhatensis]CAB5668804.1 Probable efflux pump outer membrane protein ttgC precursor [Delftia tsuruhatensis]CAC9682664.1 Probable efflux pump outer membrane protein ttgC precursor [Delftia tsuruhatensis]